MTNILDKIFEKKKEELTDIRHKIPMSEIKAQACDQPPCLDVMKALDPLKWDSSRIIAEIKRRTPFKGEICSSFDPFSIAIDYAKYGAAAISIITESHYFGGSLNYLTSIKELVNIPLLRKDFIFDEYQVIESRAFGADLFLLIATTLETNQMEDLIGLGKELGLKALVETHDESDMEKAFRINSKLIGINNRDLTSGKTDLNIARRLLKFDSFDEGTLLICESGINCRSEIEEFEKLGAHAFLVGESLMRSDNIPQKLKQLQGQDNNAS
tara:strand:- start:258 stop:1067 length:810 start_codon:yes stop_codon:yes gene_type:complete